MSRGSARKSADFQYVPPRGSCSQLRRPLTLKCLGKNSLGPYNGCIFLGGPGGRPAADALYSLRAAALAFAALAAAALASLAARAARSARGTYAGLGAGDPTTTPPTRAGTLPEPGRTGCGGAPFARRPITGEHHLQPGRVISSCRTARAASLARSLAGARKGLHGWFRVAGTAVRYVLVGDWLGDVQSIGATPRARVGGVASEGSGLRCAQGDDGLDLVSVESGTKRLRSKRRRGGSWSVAERVANPLRAIARRPREVRTRGNVVVEV